ncbi:SDR family oxidoreductase [Sorangium sp. So ce315]|uniref:SDR family oxidoreductase n=1 Tax=Sorangium sp. So ce315 TaxID=3133299 RepID=UPI003F5E33AE
MTQARSIFAPGLFGNQVAIITGGGSGIGLACARELAHLGAKVALCGRKADKLEAAAGALASDGIPGGHVLAAPCDIREPEQIAAFVGQVLDRFGRVDVLVNNAGGQFPSPAADMTPRGWEAVVRNNLNGTFFMTREVARRAMIPARRGRVVNVTASVGRGFPGMAHTGAARAGVENLTRSLAVEWAAHGIRVNAVAPGNNIRSSGTAQYGDELLELARRATPLKRLGTPEEVARLIVFLASDQNDFITGAVYGVDGGQPLWGDIWSIPEPEGPEPEAPEPEGAPGAAPQGAG